MKMIALVAFICLAIGLPTIASANVWINQTVVGGSTSANPADTVAQSFTTPNIAGANQYRLQTISVHGLNFTGNPSGNTVTMRITNSTQATIATASTTFFGSADFYNFTFNGVDLSSNTQYAFNMTDTGVTHYSISGADVYAGGNLIVNGVALAGQDAVFLINLSNATNSGNWHLNEGTGTFANDSSGFNNNGTFVDTPTWATSLNNGSVNISALSFGGFGNITVPTSASLNTTGELTINAWIKTINTSGASLFIASKGNTTAFQYSIELVGASGKLQTAAYTCAGGTSLSVTGTTSLNDGKWHMVTGVFSNGSFTSAYVDGNLDATSSTVTGLWCSGGVAPFEIGGRDDSQNLNFNGTIDEVTMYNYVLNQSQITTVFQQFQPVPAYPVANTIISAAFPPLQTTVNFTWYDTVYPSDEIQVAQDQNFNVMVHDGFHTTDFANIQLNPGQTYFWRLKQFNSTSNTFGATSETQTFTIAPASSVTGSGSSIQGIVFEVINGVQTPVSGTQVYLTNATNSFEFTTSSSGYFLFQNLAANSTYSIHGENAPIYNPTAVFPVTTGNGTTVTQNLLITRFFSPFVPNYVYEKFSVRGIVGDTVYPGVTVSVFNGNDVTPLFTKLTDSMGQATFQLVKDNYYRVEFSGGGLAGTQIEFLYGKEEEYLEYVTLGFPRNPNLNTIVLFDINISSVNSTAQNLTVSYNDTSGTTTILNFFAKSINATNSSDMSTVCSQQLLNMSVGVFNCSVSSAPGLSYVWGFNATTGLFGFIDPNKVITFGGHGSGTQLVDTGVDNNTMQWISIALIIAVGSIFSARTLKLGAVAVAVVAGITFGFGWFAPIPGNQVASGSIIGIVFIIAIINYMRSSEVKTVY